MLFWVARIACFVLVLSGCAASADDLADFNAALESASSHNRVAIGYLRTGNADLAALEIERLRDSWTRLVERFSGKRPEAFDGNQLYGNLFTVVSARLVGADLMLKTGRLDAARHSLDAIRGDLYDLRKASGIVVLADCVRDANVAMDVLTAYDDRAFDLNNIETRKEIAAKASSYGSTLGRCDGIATFASCVDRAAFVRQFARVPLWLTIRASSHRRATLTICFTTNSHPTFAIGNKVGSHVANRAIFFSLDAYRCIVLRIDARNRLRG